MEEIIQNSVSEDHISKASQALAKGLTILYPTDTVWGLGCNALNESAVAYIREIKNAPSDHPMVILVNNIDMIKEYVTHIHPRIETLLLYHQQPLTIIYDAHPLTPEYLLSEDHRIAIRLCHDDFCNALMYDLGAPILATAASLYGQAIPRSFSDIPVEIQHKVDHVVNYKQDVELTSQPSIIASYNHKGDLEFIRD